MRKVSSGQKLSIPASTFNTMLDAAADYQRRSFNRQSEAIRPDTANGIVLVRNSAGNRDQFTIVGLSNVLITPAQNAQEFATRFAFDAVAPASTHVSKFAVLQVPLKSGAIGPAMIVGVTPALMRRAAGETSEFAGIEAGQQTLRSGIPGAQVLWEESVAADVVHLAVVRLPHQQSSGGTGNQSARVASTANAAPSSFTATTITFGAAPSIDGLVPPIGTIVLLKNQTAGQQNGVYKVGASNVWTREGTITSGMLVTVRDGVRNAGSVWVLRTNDPITVGTTALTFANRQWNEYMPVRAASTTKASPADGITLAVGDRLLVTTGVDVGAWEFQGGANFDYLDKPLTVGVREGGQFGLLQMFLNNAGTAYVKGQAVYV